MRRSGTEQLTSIRFYCSPPGPFKLHTNFPFSPAFQGICSIHPWWIVHAIKDYDPWTSPTVVLLWKGCTFAQWITKLSFRGHLQWPSRRRKFPSREKDALCSDSAPISILSFSLMGTQTDLEDLILISCNGRLNSGAQFKKKLWHFMLQRLNLIRKREMAGCCRLILIILNITPNLIM